MITGPIITEIAALIGDPARATIVVALLDGRALTASELAVAARITPQTARSLLAKLTEAGVLSAVRNGRNRYFRLASPAVADMIDGIVAVALERKPRYHPLSRQARALSATRICFDHLAGRLSVDLTDSLVASDSRGRRELVDVDDNAQDHRPPQTGHPEKDHGRHECREICEHLDTLVADLDQICRARGGSRAARVDPDAVRSGRRGSS